MEKERKAEEVRRKKEAIRKEADARHAAKVATYTLLTIYLHFTYFFTNDNI